MRPSMLLFFALGLVACDDDPRTARDSGRPPTGMDGGGMTSLPGPVDGLGATATDCVEWCRTAVGDCSRVIVFIDRPDGCSGDECNLDPVGCASSCSTAAATLAALEASGCESQWRAYETCVGAVEPANPGLCQVGDSDCGIEWGVYKGCAGL